jgi:hypothetical protein
MAIAIIPDISKMSPEEVRKMAEESARQDLMRTQELARNQENAQKMANVVLALFQQFSLTNDNASMTLVSLLCGLAVHARIPREKLLEEITKNFDLQEKMLADALALQKAAAERAAAIGVVKPGESPRLVVEA